MKTKIKITKQLRKSVKSHAKQADTLEKKIAEESNPRIPRKKGQPANSKKHSIYIQMKILKELFTDSVLRTKAIAKASVSKIRKSSRSHAHKIQAAVAMEQRAREMGKTLKQFAIESYQLMKRKPKNE